MRFNNLEPPVPKMLVQHFAEAFRHPGAHGEALIVVSDGDAIVPLTDLEEDCDEVPLRFADVLKLDGFKSRWLAFDGCG